VQKYLYELLKERAGGGVYPFHMPGHKARGGLFGAIFPEMDTTELGWTDNLYSADGVLKHSMERAANVFGAGRTYFLTNGSTAGIIAAIMSVARESGELIVARNSHRSVYGALILSGAVPRYVYPGATPFGAAGGVGVAGIKEAAENYPNAAAAIVTSPTYEGFVSDIRGIAGVLHEKNIPLIVDEAHGAHCVFHADFPETALSAGADVVVQSLHKTLPALGQTALLHVSEAFCGKEDVGRMLPLVMTGSPSYLLMGLADKLVGELSSGGHDFGGYMERLGALRDSLGGLKNFSLTGREMVGKYFIHDIDISKLLMISNADVTGTELAEKLVREYKLQFEMSGENYILGLTGVADGAEAFFKLAHAMEKIDAEARHLTPRPSEHPAFTVKTVLPPRRAFFAKVKKLPIEECAGEVAADFILQTPPGVPLIAPGEFISREIAEYTAGKNLIKMFAVVDE